VTEPTDYGTGYGRLNGRTALVTGSTRGLGIVIAEWLARDGANIVVSGREQDDVDRAVNGLRAYGTTIQGIAADLAILDDAHRLIEQSFEIAPELDIVINNAGMSIPQPFWECSDADYAYQHNVNQRSPFVINQFAAKRWISGGTRGRIVNVSTVGVFSAHTDRMVYNMSKSAIQAMTRNMSSELGPYGITVNCVAPGNVADRPGVQDFTADERANMNARIPLGRIGRAGDIASTVRYFCLPESEWTTGQTLLVDGGMVSSMGEVAVRLIKVETE
jgi:NAD(P)-dependent dehydrogenase (short-subunit alcohol dehydrogenase family)